MVIGGIPISLDGAQRMLIICVEPTIGQFTRRQPVKTDPISERNGNTKLPRLNILGPLTKTKVALLPPSDDELLMAFEKHLSISTNRPLTREQLPKIQLTKLSERSDEARFVPLIGNAILQYNIYECTMTRDAYPGTSENALIDHNYFQVVADDTAK